MALRRADHADLPQGALGAVARLYKSSFPVEERVPFAELRRGLAEGRRSLWLDDSALAFAITAPLSTEAGDVLLEYVAVEARSRSRGLGQSMLRGLLNELPNPIVLEVEDPSASSDAYAARRIGFYERLGARRIPFSEPYEMPNLDGDGLVPMRLFDLDPGRRASPWSPALVRGLITHLWTDGYDVGPEDARLRDVLERIEATE